MLQRLSVLFLLTQSILAAPFYGRLIERESELLESYNYIVVGGGTAGLVVANRLTEDRETTVLVLEAGIVDQKECAAILQRCLGDTMRTKYDWNVTTVPQTFISGNRQNLTLGKALGGSSLMNGMMHDRPSPGDIDLWEQLGNEGWGWDGLLPYYKKHEKFTPPSEEQIAEFGITWDPSVHGDSGYIQSSYPHFIYPQNRNFQEALISLGVNQSHDQAGNAIGVFWSPNTIDPKNQTRSYSRSGYYEHFAERKNLHAITSRHVTKLITEADAESVRVIGVEFVENGKTTTYTAKASKEVIVSAGAVHTPQILQLSGIGARNLLEKFDIPVVIDLPGVGNNFQDHPFTTISLQLDNVEHSPWDLDRNATYDAEMKELFYTKREGPWTAGGPNSVAFLPLATFSSRHSERLATYAAQSADDYLRADLDTTVITGYEAQRKVLLSNLVTDHVAAMEFIWLSGANRGYQMPFSISIQHPFSRGYIEINSTDPFVQPVVDFRTGSNPTDVDLYIDAFRFSRKIVDTPAIQELVPAELLPGVSVVTDEELRSYVESTLSTMFHPSGTSAMMPRALGGVVSDKLVVHGTVNLRVVDASIMPLIPASHLQSTVYAIAEKAADIIKAAA